MNDEVLRLVNWLLPILNILDLEYIAMKHLIFIIFNTILDLDLQQTTR